MGQVANNVRAAIEEKLEETKTALSGSGRVLIRPSGTEPLIRVMIEGSDQEMIDSYCRRIAELIESKAR